MYGVFQDGTPTGLIFRPFYLANFLFERQISKFRKHYCYTREQRLTWAFWTRTEGRGPQVPPSSSYIRFLGLRKNPNQSTDGIVSHNWDQRKIKGKPPPTGRCKHTQHGVVVREKAVPDQCSINRVFPILKKITTWRSRSSQIAGSSTQQLLLCNNATFDDIILQHLMTSFCIRWHHFEWLAHFGFWINRGKKFISKAVHNFSQIKSRCRSRSRCHLDLDLHLD